MNSKTIRESKKILFCLCLFFLSVSVYAQTTFKVVCDKTDNTVKVIESDNRSPNYVPIKGGFPFRQVAQKWIDENYSTTKCDPGKIINEIQKKNKTSKPLQKATEPSNISSSATKKQGTTTLSRAPAKAKLRNTSLLIAGKFSTLGEAFGLNEKLMKGFGAGIEQLFGNKTYFGIGANMDLYMSDMDNLHQLDNKEMIYFLKIPAFIGFRTTRNNISTSWETGVAANTRFTGTELTLESFGQTARDQSYNFLARMKIGGESIMFEMGSEIWLSEIFEDDDFKMTTVYLGLRFNF